MPVPSSCWLAGLGRSFAPYSGFAGQPADALESLGLWQPWYFDWQSSCLVPSSAYWSDSCSSFAGTSASPPFADQTCVLLCHQHDFVGQSFGIKPFHQGLLVGICLLLHLHLFGIGLSFCLGFLRPLKASAAAPCSKLVKACAASIWSALIPCSAWRGRSNSA